MPFDFNPTTLSATRIPLSASLGYVEAAFSLVNPDLIYGVGGANGRTLQSYSFVTQQVTVVQDLDGWVTGLSGFVGSIQTANPSGEQLVAMFGGNAQDLHHYMVTFPVANPSARLLLDTMASTINGVATSSALGFHLHAYAVDVSGRFINLYPAPADNAPAPVYVWDTQTSQFTALTETADNVGGHDALGYGQWINQDCCKTYRPWDPTQHEFRLLSSPHTLNDLLTQTPYDYTPNPPPNDVHTTEVYLANHLTWTNARQDVLVPVVASTYRYSTNSMANWRAWDNEVIALQTAPPPAGTQTAVWRFAQNESNVTNDTDPTKSVFWYEPTASVSPDGLWILFTSNWQKTLGDDPYNGNNDAPKRQDVFLIKLIPGSVPTASMTSPSNGSQVSGDVQATATASGGSGIARVEFWLDGTSLIGTATTSPYTVTWHTTQATNGTHSLGARAFDTSGAEGDSATVSVDVENSTGGQQVTWTQAVNATVTGSTIQKTGGCDGCEDAGGVSQQQISAVGSFVQFTPIVNATTGPSFRAGLASNPGTPPSINQLNYEFGFWPDHTWDIHESGGVYKANGPWTVGDVFKIAIESGPVVAYYVNNTKVWTSTVVPSGAYVLAADLYDNGAAVQNAQISGTGGGGGLPAGWTSADIGSTGQAGSASYSSSTFTVNGSGANIWTTADSFQFVYEALPGDGQLIAHVASLTNTTSSSAKAGIMIRTSLDPGSPEVTVDFKPGGLEFLWRQTQGGTTILAGGTALAPPNWVKLVRVGSTVFAYNSTDGVNWSANGSETIPAGQAYIGLVVCSHDTTSVTTATFDHISQ